MNRLCATLIATSVAATLCVDASAQNHARNGRGGPPTPSIGGPPVIGTTPSAPTPAPGWGQPPPPVTSTPCTTTGAPGTSTPTPPVSVWGTGLPVYQAPVYQPPPVTYSPPTYSNTNPIQQTTPGTNLGHVGTSSRARAMLTPVMPLNPRNSSPNLSLTPVTAWNPTPVVAPPPPVTTTPCTTPPIVVAGPGTPNPRPVPEPSTLALLGVGLAALAFSRRRARRA